MENRLVQQRAFFFAMMAILAILDLILVWPFVQTILLAVAVVIIMKPVYSWLLDKKWFKSSENRAAGVTLIVFVLVIAIPTILIVASAIFQASRLFSGLDLEGIDFTLSEIIKWIEGTLRGIGAGIIQIDKSQLFGNIAQFVSLIASCLGTMLVSLGQFIPSLVPLIGISLVAWPIGSFYCSLAVSGGGYLLLVHLYSSSQMSTLLSSRVLLHASGQNLRIVNFLLKMSTK